MQHWIYLMVAIIAEVIATLALKQSEGFSRLWPSLIVVCGYGTAFFFMALTIRSLPVGIVYAIWSGLGVVLITTLAWILFDQRLQPSAIVGMGLIVSGVVVINLFSNSGVH